MKKAFLYGAVALVQAELSGFNFASGQPLLGVVTGGVALFAGAISLLLCKVHAND